MHLAVFILIVHMFPDEYTMKNENELANVLSSYIYPLKQLTDTLLTGLPRCEDYCFLAEMANFPKHVMEFQIDVQRELSQTPTPTQNKRRFVYYKRPNRSRYSGRRSNVGKDTDEEVTKEVDAKMSPQGAPLKFFTTTTPATTTATPSTTTTTPSTTTTTPSTTTTAPSTTTETSKRNAAISTPEKQIVYLEDLQKVFSDFALQIQATKCTGDHATTKEYPSQLVISNPGPVNSDRNIDEVLDLIRRGVQIKKHIPQPTDEDLDWLQIKIPA